MFKSIYFFTTNFTEVYFTYNKHNYFKLRAFP